MEFAPVRRGSRGTRKLLRQHRWQTTRKQARIYRARNRRIKSYFGCDWRADHRFNIAFTKSPARLVDQHDARGRDV